MHVDIEVRTVVSGVPDNYCIATHKVVEKFTSYFEVLKENCFLYTLVHILVKVTRL
jgi:hypothetical protein